MSPAWGALAARARGLSTHLLGEARLGELRGASDPRALVRLLRDSAYGPHLPTRDVAPATVEAALARSHGQRLGTLGRWAAPDGWVLAPLFLAEDLRSVRTVLRGVAGALPPERRVTGAMPTPSLGRKELETLARAESAGSVAATLVAWGHPFGSLLLAEAARARPSLFRLEAALARGYAAEASAAAERSGDRSLRAFVRESISVWNLVTALLLVGRRTESPSAELYVDGAPCPSRTDFERALAADGRPACVAVLADAMSGTSLSSAFTRPAISPVSPVSLARALLEARIERLARERRQWPVSSAPVLLFALLLRKEAETLRRALWAAAFGAGRTS